MKQHSFSQLSMLMALVLVLLPCSAVSQSNTAGAGTTNDSSIERGLVGYWTFDNIDMKWTSATAGVAYDRSGNNNTGTLMGMNRATSEIVGKIGQALKFNGSTNYIMTPSQNLPRTDSAMTISAWLSTTTLSNDRNAHDHRNAVVLNRSPLGGRSSNALQLSIRSSRFFVTASGGDIVIDSGITPNLNTWYLVTFTFDGMTNRIYVNGIEKANNRIAHQSGVSSSVWIGAYNGTNELWDGSIDDVRIYDRALAANEVRQLFRMASPQ
jgi:hypothetical protein